MTITETRDILELCYLDWFYNYPTVSAYTQAKFSFPERTNRILRLGRAIHYSRKTNN